MLFNSYPFVFVFLPLVLAGFAVLTRWRARKPTLAFLIVASLAFYAWWNWRFLALLLFSILFNFALGTRLQRRASTDGSPASDIPTHACAWKAMNGRSWRCGSRRRF